MSASSAGLGEPPIGCGARGDVIDDYFELTFTADAGKPYRLWLRAIAQNNDFNNDSVFVQFGGSADAAGTAIDRIGTTAAAAVVLEDCSGCGLQGWGWQDNGYGANVLGPVFYSRRQEPSASASRRARTESASIRSSSPRSDT